MKHLFSLFVTLCVVLSSALADVTFTVNVPAGTKYCYVVGGLPELSAWAAGAAVPMTKIDGKDQFKVTIAGVTAADVANSEGYKYTCGPDWKYVEKTTSGEEVTNRTTIGNPDVVAKWASTYNPIGIQENWKINNKDYAVQILLPANYQADKQYPITYMFGRHQRYRDAGSDTEMGDRILYPDSWAVADSTEAMQNRGEEVGIIVVIYAQLPELTPWVNADFMGTGQAELFLKSFVEDFKPQFEKKYLAQATATIMGADVAGLFALYAATKYPEVFGACGAFSPALWYNKAELTNYLNAYQPAKTQTRFALAYTTQDMQTIKDDIQSIAALLAQKGYTQVQTCEGNGMHDDRSWGKLFPQLFNYLQGQTSKLSTVHLTPSTLHPTPSTLHLTPSTTTWTFMNGTSSSSLTCEGTTTQEGFYYKDGKTPQAAQMLVKEIPVDSKTYSYYWNMNNGADCNGTTLMTSPKDIGFKSSRKTLSWQRVAIFEDGAYEQSAASSAHFKVNGQTMTIGDNYTLTATISLTDDKTISVHYGSVNSGSDMGELVSTTVSDNCLKANVTYSYLTNQLLVTETAWGSSDIDLDYFKVEPAVVREGATARMSVKIANKNGYKVSFRMNQNNQPSSPITLTQGADGEEYYTITSAQSGIYGFYLDIELNGTTTKAHRAVYLKVVDGKEIETTIHQNPYEEIDWQTVNQYKANFHTHTTQSNDASDGFTTAYVVDRYYAAGYKILALTDHDYNPYPWELFPQYMPSVPARSPEGMQMLAVPGNELSKDNTNSWSERTGGQFNHHNDFFTGRQGQEFASLQESYAYTYALGGMQIINHPGQYWSIDNTYTETQKDGPGWHAKNFQTFPSLVGLEVYNQGNRRPNDRILWDQILERTIPKRNIFGYSCDDAHNNDQLFRNYNFMLMEDLTTDELKDAMSKGESYFCYEPAGTGQGKAPRITDIKVNEEQQTITIQTDGLVHWIYGTDKTSTSASSARSTVVGIGNTFSYKGYQGTYVRAFITNRFGETCTQPITFVDETTQGMDEIPAEQIALMAYPNPAIDYVSIFIKDAQVGQPINIYDMHGRCVHTQSVVGPYTKVTINHLSQGMYMVVVGKQKAKIIKD